MKATKEAGKAAETENGVRQGDWVEYDGAVCKAIHVMRRGGNGPWIAKLKSVETGSPHGTKYIKVAKLHPVREGKLAMPQLQQQMKQREKQWAIEAAQEEKLAEEKEKARRLHAEMKKRKQREQEEREKHALDNQELVKTDAADEGSWQWHILPTHGYR